VAGRGRHRRARRQAALLCAVALAAATVSGGLKATGGLRSLELDSIDVRHLLRGSRQAPTDIVIVGLDGASLAELGRRPPLPRELHARLLDRLHAAHPRLIAYDFQFVGGTRASADAALRRSIERARPVVLATHDVTGPALRIPAGEADPDRLGALLGTVGLLNDFDGKIRRLAYGEARYRAFSVVAAEAALRRRIEQRRFPARIDYRGPPGTFRAYSFARVLSGDVPPAAFRGRIVLVGSTDPLDKDVFQTPVSASPMSGVEIHANSIATILDGFPLRSARGSLNLALLLLMVVAAPLARLRLSALPALALAAVALAGLLVGAQLAFNSGQVIEVTYPTLALLVGGAGVLVVDLLTETRERRHMRAIFSRFVPEHVIETLMDRADDDLRLGGETLEATVLFCDLRGFTGFAEANTGRVVIDVLNQYLTQMSDAILAHGGTVVAYMGDGIMAVFGAPIEHAEHADQALAAAREMAQDRLAAFNRWFSEQGLGEGFRMGLGLCSGPVRSGNVGSPRRIEYAAVGDTTNVASRLQSTSKETPHGVLLADSTRVALRAEPSDLEYLGEIALRGRRAPTRVWALVLHGSNQEAGGST
jgi:adenylate cyclase